MRQSKPKLIVNLTRQTIVCHHAEIADRLTPRMRGLLGRRGLPAGVGLLLRPAPSIHTAFMRFTIDAVFLDSELTVIKLCPNLKPWRAAGASGARAVLELADGEIARLGLAVGHRLATREYLVRVENAVPRSAAPLALAA
jgi:uncharacterized membrane protein (UPF0127 family)